MSGVRWSFTHTHLAVQTLLGSLCTLTAQHGVPARTELHAGRLLLTQQTGAMLPLLLLLLLLLLLRWWGLLGLLLRLTTMLIYNT